MRSGDAVKPDRVAQTFSVAAASGRSGDCGIGLRQVKAGVDGAGVRGRAAAKFNGVLTRREGRSEFGALREIAEVGLVLVVEENVLRGEKSFRKICMDERVTEERSLLRVEIDVSAGRFPREFRAQVKRLLSPDH
jgi:hypothetical protein